MANQRIKANLIPSCDIYPVIHLAQYDVSDGTGKQVEIELYYGTDKFTIPSGSSITFRGTKRDKTGYSYEITKFTDNVVTVDVKPQMTVLSGTHFAELRISKGNTISNTIKFVMKIDSSALADDTKVSETDLSVIEKALQASDSVIQAKAEVEQLKASVEKSEKNAKQSETNASQSATNAQESAESASTSATTASTKATEASTSATTASTKATEASTSATKAKESETNAKASETNASSSEQASAESANSASQSATNAQESAESASTSATTASTKATEASTSATTASTKATEASTSATKAKESETNAKASEEKSAESASSSKEYYDKIVTTQFPYNLEGLSQLEKEITARYESARNGKIFAVRHKKFAVDPSPIGEKLLDSVGLECTPSTDTVQGQDDFMQYLPFQWEHCNYVRDEDDGFARPTAIEGRENYKNIGNVDVGCISATFWWKRVDTEGDYTIYLSDMPHPELALVPWHEAVKADGSVLPYYIGSAYSSVNGDDGLPRSLPGGSAFI